MTWLGGDIPHTVFVRGKEKTWCIETMITPATAQDWRDDGLEVSECLNSIPVWAVNAGIPVRWWFFVQDVIRLRNPWAK